MEELNEIADDTQKLGGDTSKLYLSGKKSARTRARKYLLALKILTQDLRALIQDEKNKMRLENKQLVESYIEQ
eukprot:IDg21981t1